MVRRECGRTKEGGCRKTDFGSGRREIDGDDSRRDLGERKIEFVGGEREIQMAFGGEEE